MTFIPSIKNEGRVILDQYGRLFNLEPTTWALPVIDYSHKEIHDQNGYLAIYSALKDDTETIEVRIGTSNSPKRAHLTIHILSGLASTAQLWKNTTKTDEVGNRVTAINRDFESTNN